MTHPETTSGSGHASSARDQLRDQVRTVGKDVKEVGESGKHAAKDLYERGKQKAGEYYERGKEQAAEFEQQFRERVRDNPWKSLLIAAGAGLLVGVLLGRR